MAIIVRCVPLMMLSATRVTFCCCRLLLSSQDNGSSAKQSEWSCFRCKQSLLLARQSSSPTGSRRLILHAWEELSNNWLCSVVLPNSFTRDSKTDKFVPSQTFVYYYNQIASSAISSNKKRERIFCHEQERKCYQEQKRNWCTCKLQMLWWRSQASLLWGVTLFTFGRSSCQTFKRLKKPGDFT